MTAPDATPVEPLKLTLEEARRRYDAASAELQRLCEGKRFRMSIPAQPDDSDVVLGDALQALKALTEGHDLAARDTADLTTVYMVGFAKGQDSARDDVAELVEAVDTFLSRLEGFLGTTTAALEAWERGSGPNIPIPVYSAAAARLATSGDKLRAMLARVKGGEG